MALLVPILISLQTSAQVVDTPFMDLNANNPVTDAEFLAALSEADIILLGERHGREGFQERERQILEALVLNGVYPALVFEMLTPSQMPALEAHRTRHPEAASGLGVALTWWETGWPAWSFYQPIFEIAYTSKLPIYAGDLDEENQLAAREGETMGPNNLNVAPFGLQGEGSAYHESWLDSLDRAHCGLVERSELADRASLQVARDQSLALAVAKAAQRLEPNEELQAGTAAVQQPVVLIAGSAHTRLDRGVGAYLAGVMPEVNIVSVVMRERTWSSQGHIEQDIPGELGQAYDYQWSVVVEEIRPGQCDRLREAGLIGE